MLKRAEGYYRRHRMMRLIEEAADAAVKGHPARAVDWILSAREGWVLGEDTLVWLEMLPRAIDTKQETREAAEWDTRICEAKERGEDLTAIWNEAFGGEDGLGTSPTLRRSEGSLW